MWPEGGFLDDINQLRRVVGTAKDLLTRLSTERNEAAGWDEFDRLQSEINRIAPPLPHDPAFPIKSRGNGD